MLYIATRFEPDSRYSETFKAGSWAEAEDICKAKGWWLDGDSVQTINVTCDEDAAAICDALNERDESLSH